MRQCNLPFPYLWESTDWLCANQHLGTALAGDSLGVVMTFKNLQIDTHQLPAAGVLEMEFMAPNMRAKYSPNKANATEIEWRKRSDTEWPANMLITQTQDTDVYHCFAHYGHITGNCGPGQHQC